MLSIIDWLPEDRHRIVVVCGTGDIFPEQLEHRGIEFYQRSIIPRNKLNYWRNTLFFEKLVRKRGIDLIYANSITASIASSIAAMITGCRFIVHIRDRRVLSELKKFLINRAYIILTNSKATADNLTGQGFSRGKVRVLYDGLEARWFEPGNPIFVNNLPKDGQIVGFCGQVIPTKGVDVLLKATALLKPAYPLLRVCIVGDDMERKGEYLRRMRILAQDLGLDDRAIFPGFVSDTRDYISTFDILAMPSIEEPFGRVAIEGQAQGKPVVASRVGGLTEIIQDGVNGLLVKPGSAEELAAALRRLLDDKKLRDELAVKGRENALKKYTLERMVKEIDGVICGMIKRK